MMKFDVLSRLALRVAIGAGLAAALVACGGGGGSAGTPGVGPGSGASGPSSGASAVASDLTLALSAPSVDNSGSKTITATVTAVDANRNVLSGIPIQLSVSDASAFVATSGPQTNASGQVTGIVSIGQDRTNRTVTVKAVSGVLEKTAAFEVTGTKFTQASAVPSVVAAGAAGAVQYTLADVNGNPMVKVPISVSGSGLTSQSGETNQNGGYTFNYTAPNSPGTTLAINAVAGGAESLVTVTIPGGSTTVPVARVPVSKALNLSANVVTVNTGNTSNQVSINAFFRDGGNAPINNVRVLFGVTGDTGSGNIASGSNAVLSDTTGTASTTYKPGAVASPTNGVTIQACWKTSDFAAGETVGNCPASNLLATTLTIVDNPVSISIGTDNTISEGPSTLTYVKKYVVLVVDSAGNPKPGVQITPSVDLGGYQKGTWIVGVCGNTACWVQNPTVTCPNEDLNRNGVIDTPDAYGNLTEDVNSNGQLDPRKSDVSITLSGATKTDANGVAVLQLEYPKSIGSWVEFKITVTAAGVLSPPAYYPLGAPVALPSKPLSMLASVDDYLITYKSLPVAAKEVGDVSNQPSFLNSPYGKSSSCTDTK